MGSKDGLAAIHEVADSISDAAAATREAAQAQFAGVRAQQELNRAIQVAIEANRRTNEILERAIERCTQMQAAAHQIDRSAQCLDADIRESTAAVQYLVDRRLGRKTARLSDTDDAVAFTSEMDERLERAALDPALKLTPQ